ncbi:MAG: hypothetical protein ACXVA9_04385 [Bdellovibrionales bacterium]
MNKIIFVIIVPLLLTACGTLSMTRESPVVKKRHDFSIGAGAIYMQSPFHGSQVREEKKPNAAFGAVRFGLTDDIELMASGAALLFAGNSYEFRGKWRWFQRDKYTVASSLFYLTDNDTQQGSSITYATTGEGFSTALGYRYSPAITPYLGGKIIQLNLHYRDTYVRSAIDRNTNGTVAAVFAGVTYQYFMFGVPYDTDFMITVAMLPKEIGNDTLSPYPMATASVWWRH